MTGTTPNPVACDDMKLLVQADLDGELDAAASAVLAGHLRDCPGCAALAAELGGLAHALHHTLRTEAAPARLRAALEAQLMPPPAPARRRWRFRWPVLSFGAGAAVAAALVLMVALPQGDNLDGALLSGHIRAMQPGHLIDVPSSDRHTVKPWFEGKLDFAPPVPDLTADGFVLIGGRLDVIEGRSVAVLVYRHDKHPINLFIWPEPGTATGETRRDGYVLRHWHQGGLALHAVSDLDAAELAVFVRAWQGQQ